jgi:tetratricopeptide (TPR) repeat protein
MGCEVTMRRMQRSASILVALLWWCGAASAQQRLPDAQPCPTDYDFVNAYDYHDPKHQIDIRGYERNHLNADVENLVKGQSTAKPGGDLRFILNVVPNHPRALAALMRLATVEHTDTPAESGPYTVRCWLHRATVFSPRDGTTYLMYGVFLAQKDDARGALEQLQRARELLPNNAEVEYNLGLVNLSLKEYETARAHARRSRQLVDVRAVRRAEDELVGRFVVEVDEARVRPECVCHASRDEPEHLLEVERRVDRLDRLGQKAKMPLALVHVSIVPIRRMS